MVENLFDYQKKAITTKIYDNSVRFPYVVLGIVGETSELYEKIGIDSSIIADLNLLGKEVADIFWYLAAWAEETGQNLQVISEMRHEIFDWKTISREEVLLKLSLLSGSIAEVTKKALRDDFKTSIQKDVFPKEKQIKINFLISDLIHLLSTVCKIYSLPLFVLLQENLDKLQSRKERGVLGGSGDLR